MPELRTRLGVRRSRPIAVALAIMILPLTSARSIEATSHPDFSGKWAVVSERAAPFGKSFTITSDATSLHVNYVSTFTGGTVRSDPAGGAPISTQWTRDISVSLTYKFDGSENRNAIQTPDGNSLEIVSKSTWDGDKFVIVTTSDMPIQRKENEAPYVGDVVPGRGLPARLLPAGGTIPAVHTTKQVMWMRADGMLLIDALSVVDTGLSSEIAQPDLTKSQYLKAG